VYSVTEPLVSVLLPFRNPGVYFAPAVESILCQTLSDFELLLLDDGSTDDSPNFAETVGARDSRIRHIRAESSIGLSAQLNKGIELARGRYLARMDADDISMPQRFEKQVALLQREPSIGICGTIAQEFSDRGMGHRWILPQLSDDVFCLMFLRCCFNHPSVMIRASCLLENGLRYDESYIVAQDYALWYQLLKLTGGYNIQEPLLHYRRFPEQLSQAASPRKLTEVEMLRRQIRHDLGISESEVHSRLHAAIASDRWLDSEAWFNEATEWLNLVWQANLDTHLFPYEAFGRMLSEKLFLHCSMASRRGLNGWRIYQRAKFRSLKSARTLAICRMLAKTLFLRRT
jgi:glycosyltransferase involved in cell wall biosynthesis